MRFINIILILPALVFGLLFYGYKIDKTPPHLYIDEAARVYDAVSILKTGKDEYGTAFPLVFKSAGLNLVPLYTYLTVIPVKLFGPSLFSARAVAIVSGILSALIVYLLMVKSGLFKRRLPVLAGTVLLVVNPWLFFYSRIGYEISLGFLFFALSAYFLWLSLKRRIFLTLSFIVMALSLLTAHFELFLSPLLLFGFLIIFRKETLVRKNVIYLVSGAVFGFLILAPYIVLALGPLGSAAGHFYKDEILVQAGKINLPYFLSLILAFIREFFSRYVSYFSPRSLFFEPDPDMQRSLPGLSVFFPLMVMPYLAGLYFLAKENRNKFFRFLLLILAIAPIPASLARDPFATHRAIPVLLPLIFIITMGIEKISERLPRKVWFPGFLVLLVTSGVLLWRSYFILLPKERAGYWGYGIDRLAKIIAGKPGTHFVIDESRMKPLYINLAYYLKTDPGDLQKEINPPSGFLNIEFRSINWEKDIYKNQVLVGDSLAISEGQAKEHFLTKDFQITDPVGNIIFVGYETDPGRKLKGQ